MSPEVREDLIRRASELLRGAHDAVVLTGAGISTPSGIPDFRTASSGLWTKSDPMEVASLSAFRDRPRVFFDWLHPLAATIRGAQPNPAHQALAELEAAGVIKTIITQNIDGLHQAAGSKNVIEVHGSLIEMVCPRCRRRYPSNRFWDAFVDENQIPRCPEDQTYLKPDIVLFEEILPEQAWSDAETACARADVMIVIGSSLEVGPANMLPVTALEAGADLIINTHSRTFLDEHASILLPWDTAEVLPRLAKDILG